MALAIILLVLLAVLVYLLLAPFYVEINSVKNCIKMRFHRLASAEIFLADDVPILKITIVGWHRDYDIFKIIGEKIGEKKSVKLIKKAQRNKTIQRKFRMTFKHALKILKSFQIKKCFITVDTGDMPLNGILFPIVYGIKCWSKKDISINFLAETEVVLVIRNTLARTIRAVFSN